jgi:hypothetical protein
MSEPADIQVATFEAKCAAWGHALNHPSVGDMGYGQMLFCAENGALLALSLNKLVEKIGYSARDA